MSKRTNGIIIGFLLGALLTGSFAFAKTGTEYIQAAYRNIKIYVNGTQINPKDTTGRPIEAFISNSTTYLPVRAVAEALGENVSWDDKTSSVYIGGTPTTSQNWMDQCKPYEVTRNKIYLLNQNEYFKMAGKEYTNGFVLGNGSTIYTSALFNLNGNYNSLSFKVGLLEDNQDWNNKNADLTIYVDGTPIHRETLKWDAGVKTITVPLNDASNMKIELCSNGYEYGFADGVFK